MHSDQMRKYGISESMIIIIVNSRNTSIPADMCLFQDEAISFQTEKPLCSYFVTCLESFKNKGTAIIIMVLFAITVASVSCFYNSPHNECFISVIKTLPLIKIS